MPAGVSGRMPDPMRPDGQGSQAMASAWGDWIANGARDFGDFADRIKSIFKRMLADMIAQAAQSGFMRMLGGLFGVGGSGILGRTWEETTAEAATQRIAAEGMIATINAILGTTVAAASESAANAGAADRLNTVGDELVKTAAGAQGEASAIAERAAAVVIIFPDLL